MTVVLKFGGSSLTHKGYEEIVKQVNEHKDVLIVVSAIQNTTNNLMKIINLDNHWETLEELEEFHVLLGGNLGLNQKQLHYIDYIFSELKDEVSNLVSNPLVSNTQTKVNILSYGEILSSIILEFHLKNQGLKSMLLNSKSFIHSTAESKSIDPKTLRIGGKFYIDTEKLKRLMTHQINVVQGFIGTTKNHKTCLMTRSGSDTTASLIASAIRAERLEIWTDVDGMYNCDPNLIPEAKLIEKISYSLCQEISTSGSHVIHPMAISPCKEHNIPIFIRNTYNPNGKHTAIYDFKDEHKFGISYFNDVSLVKICSMNMWQEYGFAEHIFKKFSQKELDLDVITSSSVSISVTINEKKPEKIDEAVKELSRDYKVTFHPNCSCITLVNENVYQSEIMTKICELKKKYKLIMVHPSSNERGLHIVIDSIELKTVMGELFNMFLNDKTI